MESPTPQRPALGQMLLDRGLLNAQELELALLEQQSSGKSLGRVVTELRLVSLPALSDVLAVQSAWRPLGAMLVDKGLITEDELAEVLAEQERSGGRLGDIIQRRGLVSSSMLDEVLAEQHRLEAELERGFGGGLRREINRRHELARARETPVAQQEALPVENPVEAPLPTRVEASASPETQSDRIRALQEALEDRERALATLVAADRRKTEEIERLRADLAERDALLAAVQPRQHGEARADKNVRPLRRAPEAKANRS